MKTWGTKHLSFTRGTAAVSAGGHLWLDGTVMWMSEWNPIDWRSEDDLGGGGATWKTLLLPAWTRDRQRGQVNRQNQVFITGGTWTWWTDSSPSWCFHRPRDTTRTSRNSRTSKTTRTRETREPAVDRTRMRMEELDGGDREDWWTAGEDQKVFGVGEPAGKILDQIFHHRHVALDRKWCHRPDLWPSAGS